MTHRHVDLSLSFGILMHFMHFSVVSISFIDSTAVNTFNVETIWYTKLQTIFAFCFLIITRRSLLGRYSKLNHSQIMECLWNIHITNFIGFAIFRNYLIWRTFSLIRNVLNASAACWYFAMDLYICVKSVKGATRKTIHFRLDVEVIITTDENSNYLSSEIPRFRNCCIVLCRNSVQKIHPAFSSE